VNRHLSRTIVMQSLYEWDFRPDLDIEDIAHRNIDQFEAETDEEYIVHTVHGVLTNRDKIDPLIQEAAPEWPIDQIAVIDKTILRLATYELLIDREVPPKVVINEAVELAKSFGSDNSSKFINGVLGTLYRQSDLPQEAEVAEILEQHEQAAEESVPVPPTAHVMTDEEKHEVAEVPEPEHEDEFKQMEQALTADNEPLPVPESQPSTDAD